jgi:N-acetylmuramic acid 6-phosphate etherase
MTPPDRAHVATEGVNPRTGDLHALDARTCAARIIAEDREAFDAVARAEGAIGAFIEAAEPGFVTGGRLVYVGAGTSGRLGVLDASEAPPTFQVEPGRIVGIIAGGDVSLRRSSEGMEDDPRGSHAALAELALNERDALLGIAAGGTTPYVLGAIAWARQLARPPVVGLLTCAPGAAAAPPGTLMIELGTGPEVIAGSTRMKAGTATKMTLNVISTTLMVRAGKVYRNLMVDLRATNDKLRDRAARIVSTLTGLGRAESLTLLTRAGWSVKCAVVMHARGAGQEEAERLLAQADGRLDRVLEGGRP